MIRMTPFAVILALAAVTSASAQITIRYAPVASPQGEYAPVTQTSSQPWREPATGSIQVFRPNAQELAPPVTAPVVVTQQPQLAPIPASAPVVGPSYAAPVNYGQATPVTAYAPVQYAPATRTYYPANQIQPVNYYTPTSGYPVRRVANYADPCGCQPAVGYAPATQAYNPGAYQVAATSTAGVPHYAWQPVVALRGVPDNYFVGQGIIGQPKVYVEGEPVRNFFRYLLP